MDYPLRRRLYLFLLNKLRLPRSLVTAVVKGLTRLLEPRPAVRRRTAAKPLLAAANRDVAVPDEAGYRLLRQDELPGTAPLLETCRRIFEAARAMGELDRQAGDASKRFLVPVCE